MSARERTPITADTCVDRSTLATFLGITGSRISDLVASGHVTMVEHNRYPVIDAVQGYIRSLRETASGKQDKNDWTKARAELLSLTIAEKRGEVVKVSAVEEAWGDMVMRFKQRILALPHKAAPLLVNEDSPQRIAKTIGGLVDEALAELASSSDVDRGSEADAEQAEATA